MLKTHFNKCPNEKKSLIRTQKVNISLEEPLQDLKNARTVTGDTWKTKARQLTG